MNFDPYAAIDAVNFSTLKAMAVSPLHYLYASQHPRADTDTMRCGRLNHAVVFSFDDAWPQWEGGNRAGKDWAAFKATHGGDYVWKLSELDNATALSVAIREHLHASPLLTHGEPEKAFVWEDPITGIRCKGRADLDTGDTIVELKTVEDITRRGIEHAIAGYKYHAQAAMYVDGLQRDRFVWIFAEKNPPHDVVVVPASMLVLSEGRALYQSWLRRLAECRASNVWPGTAPEPLDIELLPWANDGMPEEEIEL
jgi:hypothetical protein